MKAKPIQINALIPQIKKDFKGACFFGPDFGMVQELSEKTAKIIVPNLQDEFSVIKLTPSKLKEIPTILIDEGNAPSFLGGRKLIWLKEADNNMLSAVENYFEQIKTDSFLLITAGNLTKNSALRQFCETHSSILTVACYTEEAKDVAVFIREVLAEKGIQISSTALPLLVERLGENRMATRRELDKLLCYLGDKKVVDLNDVFNIITDTQNASMDVFCHAVATGDMKKAEKEYHLMLENGENPVGIIRILYNYFNKLLDAADTMEKSGLEAAVKKIMKPAQFRLESSFQKQIKIWKKTFVLKVLSLLIDSERQVKSTGLPSELILNRIVIQITNVARKSK